MTREARIRRPWQGAVISFLFLRSVCGIAVDLPVEHSIGGAFTTAGSLQGSILELTDTKSEKLSLFRKEMDAGEQEALAALVQTDGDYLLRIPADPDDANGQWLQTSIPARCLAATGFEDYLQVHATPSGKLVGLNYDFAQHPCSRSQAVPSLSNLNFAESSSIPVWLPTVSPVLKKRDLGLGEQLAGKPVSKGRQGKSERARSGDKDPPAEDNRPWILKNWMIALPIAFIVVNVLGQVMGPMDLPQQGGGPPATSQLRRR